MRPLLIEATLLVAMVSAASKIPTIPLGDSGVNMPMVIVGTYSLNDTEAYAAVSKALSVGFTGAHCDWGYYNLPDCAKALKEAFDGGLKREDFFLMASVTGGGYVDGDKRFPANCTAIETELGRAPCQTRAQIEQTLQQLPVDYLDHLFLHMPPLCVLNTGSCSKCEDPKTTCEEIMEQWTEMEKYVKNGKVKSLGISNFCPSCVECLDFAKMTVKPVLNQNEMHIGWGKDMFGIWTYNRKRGIVPQAYTPLGGRDAWSDPLVLTANITKRIAAAHNKSTAAVALKWLTDNQIPLLTQSMNSAHLAADIDLWSWSFTREEMHELDTWHSGSKVDPSFCCKDWNITADIEFLV